MSSIRKWIHNLAEVYESDRRRRDRITTNVPGVLSGRFGAMPVRYVDINKRGAAIQAERALPPHTEVFVRIPELRLMGFAVVRRCSMSDGGFVLGLSFREALVHDPSDDRKASDRPAA